MLNSNLDFGVFRALARELAEAQQSLDKWPLEKLGRNMRRIREHEIQNGRHTNDNKKSNIGAFPEDS